MQHAFISLSLAAVIAAMTLGCNKGPAAVEGVVPVSGVVSFQGAPVAGASVTFFPEVGGQAAAGTTDSQGKYQLTTLNPNDGAKPGTYKVMVSKIERTGIGATISQEEQYKYLEQHGSPPPSESKNVLPELFANVTTTPLTATVQESGPNQFDFALQEGGGGNAPVSESPSAPQ